MLRLLTVYRLSGGMFGEVQVKVLRAVIGALRNCPGLLAIRTAFEVRDSG
jgi:hypothetical protein